MHRFLSTVDVLEHVFRLCAKADLASSARVCRLWRDLAMTPLWATIGFGAFEALSPLEYWDISSLAFEVCDFLMFLLSTALSVLTFLDI